MYERLDSYVRFLKQSIMTDKEKIKVEIERLKRVVVLSVRISVNTTLVYICVNTVMLMPVRRLHVVIINVTCLILMGSV